MKNNEKWAEALNEISDEYLCEAAKPCKRKKHPWFGAVAASLAAVLLVGVLRPLIPISEPQVTTPPDDPIQVFPFPADPTGVFPTLHAEVVSLAAPPRNQDTPNKSAVYNQTAASAATRYNFFTESSRLLLSGTTENALWSPVNAWLSLAMTARLTDGETRQEFLNALGAENLEELTAQAATLWEALYVDKDIGKCQLANSVWLDSACNFDPLTMEALAHDFYSSIYQADLGSKETNTDISSWINEHTGGFLKDAAQDIEVPEGSLIALYSTIYFQGRWHWEFNPERSTDGVFHTPKGDITCTFMHQAEAAMSYYWSDDFGAVRLDLTNGASMWLILPDEGISADQLLDDGDYLTLIADRYDPVTGESSWRDQQRIKVNLSVPKFDIDGKVDLAGMLRDMGIRKAFEPETADFSQAFPDGGVCLQSICQAVRVAMDEEGVTAAAFTEMIAGAAPPPEEIMDFILDRPFLFVLERAGVPLFVGVVNNPMA